MSFEPNVLIPAINTAFSHICLVTGNGDDFTARMFNAIHGMLLHKWPLSPGKTTTTAQATGSGHRHGYPSGLQPAASRAPHNWR
jgi:hypothetical protein